MSEQQNTQQPVAYRWRFGSESLDTRWYYSDVPLVPYSDRTVESLYTAQPVPRDVLMAFVAAIRDAAKRADFDIGEDVDITTIANRYASQAQENEERRRVAALLHKYGEVRAGSPDNPIKKAMREAANMLEAEPVNQQMLAALKAIKQITDGSQPIDAAGAAMVAASAIAAAETAQLLPSGPVMHMPSGFAFDEVIAAANHSDLVALTPQPASARPVAVPDERAAFEAWLQENIDDTDTVRPSKEKVDAYFAVWLARALLSAAPKPEGGE